MSTTEETLEGEQLTDEELLALAGMFSYYVFYSEEVEFSKKRYMEDVANRDNLSVEIKRGDNTYTFVPNEVLLKRVMRSIDRFPSGYREEFEKAAHYLITPLSSC